MQISVIIVNYNTYNYTCKCIQSVLEYTNGVTYEIILVDNASVECDATVFKEKFPIITLIKSEKNLGFAGGNNLGVKIAKGDYILLLNSDTELIENSIAITYNYAKSLKSLGAVTCQLVNPDKITLQPAAEHFPNIKKLFLLNTRLNKIFKTLYKELAPIYDYQNSFKADWIWATFFMFPKTNLLFLGGELTETFFMYYEDVEWCFLFNKNSLNNYYFSETKIIHYGGKSSDNNTKAKLANKSTNKFLKIHYGYIYLIAYLMLKSLNNIINNVTFCIKKF